MSSIVDAMVQGVEGYNDGTIQQITHYRKIKTCKSPLIAEHDYHVVCI